MLTGYGALRWGNVTTEHARDDANGEDLVCVALDAELCMGVGACSAVEPETFETGGDGISFVRAGAGLLPRERAERVCATCPTGALSIFEP
jgi:ferredoxin